MSGPSPASKDELDADVSPSTSNGGCAAQETDHEDASPQIVQAAQEPIPIELAQVIPDLQLHPPDDDHEDDERAQTRTTPDEEEDTSGGAWSTTVTPVEEIEGFDLRIREEGESHALEINDQPPQRNRPAHLSHSRIESLPPQRFSEVDVEDVERSHASSSRLSSYLASNGRPSSRRPSGLSNASMEEDEEIDLDAQHRFYAGDRGEGMRELSETERAGLDFVDVALDAKNGIYGSAGASHAKSRTSLEIRSDFLSSDGARGTAPPMSRNGSGQDLGVSPSGTSNGNIKLAFWKRSSVTSQDGKSEGEGQNAAEGGDADIGTSKGPATPRREAPMVQHIEQGDMGSMSRSSSHGSFTEPGKKVAGRYRGRMSTTPSPATSPHIERNPTIFGGGELSSGSAVLMTRRFSEAMTMMVANDDGEVEVIDLGSEGYPASQQRQAIEDRSSDPASNKSMEDVPGATDRITHEVTTQSGAKPQRSGRSAGPLLSDGSIPTETASDGRDTRVNTPATSVSSKGGRSAGPILGDAEGAESSPAPVTPSTSVTTSKSTGGRSAGPILNEASTSQPSGHARKPSKGPSALEAHISRTRQTSLPPKARTEDQRHLKDFELMMKESKLSEAKKAKEDEARQRKKEEEQRDAIKVWEGEILKDWRVARSSVRLREYWWKGSPPALRGKAWQLAIGNAQMLARNLCQTTKTRVADLKRSGNWPPTNPLCNGEQRVEIDVESAMEQDIDRTLPSLKLFQHEGGVMYDDLREVLDCLVLIRSDQAEELARERERKVDKRTDDHKRTKTPDGLSQAVQAAYAPQLYVPGLSLLSATLLLNLSQAETLVAVLNLIASKAWLRSIYSMDPEHLKESEAFERVLDTFLADQLPKVSYGHGNSAS